MTNQREEAIDSLVSKAQNMPDTVKKAFVKRSVEDAKKLKYFIEEDGYVDLQKLSFAIYKAYSLGAALYDGDKLIQQDENIKEQSENNNKTDVQEKMKVAKNDKVVDIERFKKVSY